MARAKPLADSSQAEFLANPALHDLAERYLHLVAEAAIDLASHWIADQALRTPETNADSFTVLEEAGEIDAALAEKLRGWAAYRNVFVHQYAEVDHRVAYRAIKEELGDFAGLRRWALAKLHASD